MASRWEGSGVFGSATVIALVAFGVGGALLGWRRGTKAIYRRSVSEPNLAPGETRRDYDRRLRRRRRVGRVTRHRPVVRRYDHGASLATGSPSRWCANEASHEVLR
jgi:hypothetical protein